MPGEIIQLSPDQFHIVDAARYPVHQFYKVMKRLGRGASAIVYELEPLIRKLRKIVLVEGKRMEGEVVEEGMIGGVDSEDSSLEEVFVKDAAFPSISMKVQFWKVSGYDKREISMLRLMWWWIVEGRTRKRRHYRIQQTRPDHCRSRGDSHQERKDDCPAGDWLRSDFTPTTWRDRLGRLFGQSHAVGEFQACPLVFGDLSLVSDD